MATRLYHSIEPSAPVKKVQVELGAVTLIVDTQTGKVTCSGVVSLEASMKDDDTLVVTPESETSAKLRKLLRSLSSQPSIISDASMIKHSFSSVTRCIDGRGLSTEDYLKGSR